MLNSKHGIWMWTSLVPPPTLRTGIEYHPPADWYVFEQTLHAVTQLASFNTHLGPEMITAANVDRVSTLPCFWFWDGSQNRIVASMPIHPLLSSTQLYWIFITTQLGSGERPKLQQVWATLWFVRPRLRCLYDRYEPYDNISFHSGGLNLPCFRHAAIDSTPTIGMTLGPFDLDHNGRHLELDGRLDEKTASSSISKAKA